MYVFNWSPERARGPRALANWQDASLSGKSHLPKTPMANTRAAVLTSEYTLLHPRYEFIDPSEVSDTASTDAAADKSGPAIRDLLAQRGQQCVHHAVVSDDEMQIRDIVVRWAHDEGVDWIITTGGTGFGVRDRTPEVSTMSSGHYGWRR